MDTNQAFVYIEHCAHGSDQNTIGEVDYLFSIEIPIEFQLEL